MKAFLVLLAIVVLTIGAVDRKPSALPPYLTYVALLSQRGLNDPTAVVLQNTLGTTVTVNRIQAGFYRINAAGAFPLGRTTVMINHTNLASLADSRGQIDAFPDEFSEGYVTIYTFFDGLGTDDQLARNTIEIRVYP